MPRAPSAKTLMSVQVINQYAAKMLYVLIFPGATIANVLRDLLDLRQRLDVVPLVKMLNVENMLIVSLMESRRIVFVKMDGHLIPMI